MIEKSEILQYLNTENPQTLAELFKRADAVRRQSMGDAVELRALIEISNYCQKDCLYCGLRKSNNRLYRYQLSPDEIFQAVEDASKIGYKTAVLQSGEDANYPVKDLCALIRRIKKETGVALTLSLGERSADDYAAMKEAGADRYLLKIETSDEALFRRLKPDGSYRRRIECLRVLKKCGYQVGSGSMVGLPGQTMEILADDILHFRDMDLDMIGVGPFIPNEDTPLGAETGGTVDLTLRVIALTRIATGNTHMPATTSIGSIDPMGREKALQAGANVLMPNMTPLQYREHYRIYPNKICLKDSPKECRLCLEGRLTGIGRTVSTSYGHSLKK